MSDKYTCPQCGLIFEEDKKVYAQSGNCPRCTADVTTAPLPVDEPPSLSDVQAHEGGE